MNTKLYTSLASVTVVSGALAAPPVMALDAVSVDVKQPAAQAGGFVGLGVGYVTDYEGSDDYEAVPAPLALTIGPAVVM